MKRTIWKYALLITKHQTITLPKGARILSVAEQGGVLYCWALVDRDELGRDDRRIAIIGTDHDAQVIGDATARFIGTVLMHAGALVWHVFELT